MCNKSKAEVDAQKAKQERARQKLLEEERKKEMAQLFQQAIIQPKVPFDTRDKKDDTMENWDQAQLENAINEQEKGRVNLNRATDIVCKFFLEAIESSKYGWFWECPNGKDCKYRHALPPGFVLKKKETEEERKEREAREKANQITIEDFLEKERHALGPDTTPVTAESFAKWKAERVQKRVDLENATRKAKLEAMQKMKQGMKNTGMTFSGRDMFEFNPDWAEDKNDGEEEDMDLSQYKRDSGDEMEQDDGERDA
ncbi:hypothetical protein HDU91_005503, partial [Kappamyces sp. JEL0680]